MHKKSVFIITSLLLLAGYGYFVYAAAPTGGYNPGQTLDPDCAPGDTIPEPCIVKSPLMTANNGLTATGSNVQLGGTLLQNTLVETENHALGFINDLSAGIDATGMAIIEYSPGSFSSKFFAGSGIANSSVNIQAISYGSDAIGQMTYQDNDLCNIAGNCSSSTVSVLNEGTFLNTTDSIGTDSTTIQTTDHGAYITYYDNAWDPLAQTVSILVQPDGIGFRGSDPVNGFTTAWSVYDPSEINHVRINAVINNNGNWEWNAYEDSRDDSGTYSPLNFLYTDNNGNVLSAPLNTTAWLLGGNSGTSSGTDFIGTSDNQDFVLKTNGDQVARFGGGSVAGSDKLFSLTNGPTTFLMSLWRDGSFAYNDDNFQNDNFGTEQNMFYFNFGNHDGLGNVQSKRAIRLGSVLNNEWDINSANVGDSSIAIGFRNTGCVDPTVSAIASGQGSIAIGCGVTASGRRSFAVGDTNQAIGDNSIAFGGSQNVAQGSGSITIGQGLTASSPNEIALGVRNTIGASRLLSVGNGTGPGSESDAFTILASGQVGVGIDNFETYTNGSIFQVGDGGTSIIGYVDNATGSWVNVSDERKKENITDLTYGLDQLLQLRPTSFDYKRNHEHTIGFIAQQVLPIIPEAVYGTESEGYGMSYATLTPVIVKAIQEMNLKITDLNDISKPNTWRDALIAWFGNVSNGITKLFVNEVETKNLCVSDNVGGKTCITKSQLDQLLNNASISSMTPNPALNPTPSPTSDPGTGSVGSDAGTGDGSSGTPSDSGSLSGDGSGSGSSDPALTE